MKLTYSKSQFEIPEGQYVTQFQGVEMIDPKPGDAPRMGKDGKVMPPPMAWRFLIMEGNEKGKFADRVTGRSPTPRSACGRMLVAVSGQILKDGMEVDLDQFKGKYFRVNVVEKEQGEGTCVSEQGIIPIHNYAPAANGSVPPPSNGTIAPPPPRRGAATAEVKFYVEANPDADPLLMTEAEVRNWFNLDATRDPGKINVCPVGGADWKPATAVFTNLVPF